jgi:hypothetical protein
MGINEKKEIVQKVQKLVAKSKIPNAKLLAEWKKRK